MISIIPFYAEYLPWFWFACAVLFAVIEGLTLTLTTVWFALSAVLMIFISLTPMSFRGQLYTFAALSLFFFVVTRPFAVKWLRVKKAATNADSLLGKKVRLCKPVTDGEKGEAKINGLVWSVASADNSPIPENSECVIEKITGVTLSVRKIDN